MKIEDQRKQITTYNPYEPRYVAPIPVDRPHPLLGVLVGIIGPSIVVVVVTWITNVWHRWYWGLSFEWWMWL